MEQSLFRHPCHRFFLATLSPLLDWWSIGSVWAYRQVLPQWHGEPISISPENYSCISFHGPFLCKISLKSSPWWSGLLQVRGTSFHKAPVWWFLHGWDLITYFSEALFFTKTCLGTIQRVLYFELSVVVLAFKHLLLSRDSWREAWRLPTNKTCLPTLPAQFCWASSCGTIKNEKGTVVYSWSPF